MSALKSHAAEERSQLRPARATSRAHKASIPLVGGWFFGIKLTEWSAWVRSPKVRWEIILVPNPPPIAPNYDRPSVGGGIAVAVVKSEKPQILQGRGMWGLGSLKFLQTGAANYIFLNNSIFLKLQLTFFTGSAKDQYISSWAWHSSHSMWSEGWFWIVDFFVPDYFKKKTNQNPGGSTHRLNSEARRPFPWVSQQNPSHRCFRGSSFNFKPGLFFNSANLGQKFRKKIWAQSEQSEMQNSPPWGEQKAETQFQRAAGNLENEKFKWELRNVNYNWAPPEGSVCGEKGACDTKKNHWGGWGG